MFGDVTKASAGKQIAVGSVTGWLVLLSLNISVCIVGEYTLMVVSFACMAFILTCIMFRVSGYVASKLSKAVAVAIGGSLLIIQVAFV